jgi:penicillin-insensitive murein endopeptidase
MSSDDHSDRRTEAPVMTRLPIHVSHWSRRCLKGLRTALLCPALCLVLAAANGAVAQDESRPTPRALSRIAHPDDSKTPAKELLARKTRPTKQEARSIGFYSSGCLAGGAALPISGPAWQVLPLSRNRNWGHPTLIRFLENLALEVRKAGIWNGLLIGDMSQLHGGPMSTGHASHQIGLDADIWLRPMPKGEPVRAEREEMMSTNVVGHDRLDVDPTKWMPRHGALIKAAALNAQVERIFVNPAIKKALCRETTGNRNGFTRYGLGGDTTTTFTSACTARRTVPNAHRKTHRHRAMAATRIWTGGSPTRGSIPSRGRRSRSPPQTCRRPAARCWPNRNANEQRDPIGPLTLVAFPSSQEFYIPPTGQRTPRRRPSFNDGFRLRANATATCRRTWWPQP